MTDVMAELAAKLAPLDAAEKQKIGDMVASEASRPWRPDPRNKRQVEAYYSLADLMLYGGEAGGGKTDLIIGAASNEHEKAVIFRNQYVDLRGVADRIIEIHGREAWNDGDYILKTLGHSIELGALNKPGAEMGWMGRPHDFIGFDEGAQISEAKVRFVLGWLRSVTPGQRKRTIIGSNPPIGGEGAWLIEWFAPWLDPMFTEPAKPGELRWAIIAASGEAIWVDGPGTYEIEGEERPVVALSRTFIPAGLKDNPYLAGTGYEAQIDALPEPIRTILRTGNFMAGREDHAMQVIPSVWVDAAVERWKRGKPRGQPMSVIGADVAVSRDETVLARLYGTWFDDLLKYPGKSTPDGPTIAGLILGAKRGEAEIAIDLTGGWGMSARDHLVAMGISVSSVVFSSGSQARTREVTKEGNTVIGKMEFLNKRAELWWKFREALDPDHGEDVSLPPDRRLKAQLCAPRWEPRGNKIVIEAKEDVAERVGSSTDDADAVIIAWSRRAYFAQAQQAKKSKVFTAVEPDEPLDDWSR